MRYTTRTQRLTEQSLCKTTRKTTLILGVKPHFLNYFSWNAKNYFKLHDFSHTRLIHWDLETFELKLEQSMDVIGQHLDLPDADWLTFGTLSREDYAASNLCAKLSWSSRPNFWNTFQMLSNRIRVFVPNVPNVPKVMLTDWPRDNRLASYNRMLWNQRRWRTTDNRWVSKDV